MRGRFRWRCAVLAGPLSVLENFPSVPVEAVAHTRSRCAASGTSSVDIEFLNTALLELLAS